MEPKTCKLIKISYEKKYHSNLRDTLQKHIVHIILNKKFLVNYN